MPANVDVELGVGRGELDGDIGHADRFPEVRRLRAARHHADGFGLADHVRAVRDYLGGSGLDAALINDDPPPDHLRAHYGERGLAYLEPTAGELAAIAELGVRAVTAPVIDKWTGPRDLWFKQDTIRHDPVRVATALLGLVDERRPRLRALP